jgi:spore coat polysaccharide biosynthesis protein SpsF
MKRIVAIIQARIGSTRLPCKMMLSLHGRPVIEWVVHRVSSAKRLDGVVVAIPDTHNDDILYHFLKNSLNIGIFRGSEHDVLKRFLNAARYVQADYVVRICADNPLVSGEAIDDLIQFFLEHPCDYAYNQGDGGRTNTYPDGFGAEIVSFSILEWLDTHARDTRYREHCLSYIMDYPDQFSIKTFDPPDSRIACPWQKFDLDTLDDYYRLALSRLSINSTPLEIVQLFSEAP